ncbi:DNA mismatch repair protein [Heterostelium album PN500]|uniref:DNA mismatch repair protein n=1 Tax=Heterostelium pallidum (strain ATCC 26659 / Pp 5 / PN500) TaxID=670386 RepID=D3BKR5_HETP5|nr:DNA mismatch repair protein [Heterostelium album PN500]EFA78495.1 DNA mismatch repair protein [Heterostelium album PN500]|eukprot:XP_020430619.1 DNA mismatch repair protein [Heterostelium album PN500]
MYVNLAKQQQNKLNLIYYNHNRFNINNRCLKVNNNNNLNTTALLVSGGVGGGGNGGGLPTLSLTQNCRNFSSDNSSNSNSKTSKTKVDTSTESTTEKQQQSQHETPAMLQYHHFKQKYPKHILLFRIGDFYEMFYDDAKEVSSLLHITLTTRGIKSTKNEIPMCGFPQHAAETYIEKLIRHGKTVAVCDQVEDVKSRSGRGSKVVKREVVRVYTPGTVTEDRFLQQYHHQNNYLLSIVPIGIKQKSLSTLPNNHQFTSTQRFALSWLDISTGSFNVSETTFDCLAGELVKISPSEILISQKLVECDQLNAILKPYHLSSSEDCSIFYFDKNREMFQEAYGDDYIDVEDQFPQFSTDQLGCIGSILNYVFSTQLGVIPHIDLPQSYSTQTSMFIDHSTRNSLEITKTFQGIRKGSLLDTIDKTITSTGSRLLHSRIQSPCLSIVEINQRLNLVQYFQERPDLIKEIRKLLMRCYDLERCIQRVYIKRAGPRDLSSIGSTLASLSYIKAMLSDSLKKKQKAGHSQFDRDIKHLIDGIANFDELLDTLSEALVDNPPFILSDGGFIQPGYSKELDELMSLQTQSKSVIEQLQMDTRKQLSIPSLKIKHNQSLGYYIEILSAHREKIPKHFIHAQTLMSHMRFKSSQLYELEEKINRSSAMALELEQKIFNQLADKISESYGEKIKKASQSLANIDISCSLALVAIERSYTRPILTENPILNIVGGRHPTVEYAQLVKTGTMKQFITNDCHLDSQKDSLLWLITGPNMGGKSTFLRQNALISIMSQIGSFVPADRAEVGIMDSIFSRVGSSDDLANDRSTFMVEMIETASILKKATQRSFVIMDEVGRGTATLDGLAIAQSIIEYLESIKCRTLFATHYHELTKLATVMKKIKCHALAVKEENGELLFTHKIMPGVSNKSYGIFCAQLAGMPPTIIKRAKELLLKLESDK